MKLPEQSGMVNKEAVVNWRFNSKKLSSQLEFQSNLDSFRVSRVSGVASLEKCSKKHQ